MKYWIARLGFATFVALTTSGAFASAYYLSDCQPGASSECVAGSNSTGAGTAAKPWQTTTKLPALRPGDTVSFAKGGAWMFASSWSPAFGTRGSPITYTSYQGAWCTGGACATSKPRLTAPANTRLLDLSNSGSPVHKEGLVINGLELRATPGSTSNVSVGVFVYNDSDWITLDNLTISGFAIGVQLAGSNPVSSGSTSDGINQNIAIRNSDIHDNTSMGILGSAVDLLVENNRFDNNGGYNVYDHNLYLSGSAARPALRMTIRGNTSTRSGTGGNGNCHSAHFVFHGVLDQLTIENNVIDSSSGADPSCYGIAVDNGYTSAEIFTNVIVRGNTVANVGNVGIGLDTCQACTIENNVIVWNGAAAQSMVGIAVPGATANGSGGTGDAIQEAIVVRNNSIYIASGGSGARGIRLDTYGEDHQLVSNLVYFGVGAASGHACFSPGALSMFALFDNNLCYDASSSGRWSADYATLGAAQRAGYDMHGSNANPLLATVPSVANGYSMALKPTSPAIGAGGRVLSVDPDIGAWQHVGVVKAVPPSAPAGVVIQ